MEEKAPIQGFEGEYEFLSNFYPSVIEYDGVTYGTVEHAFQAAKTTSRRKRKYISTLLTPAQAKREGRKLPRRKDWKSVKRKVMKNLVRTKFSEYPELREKLLGTDPRHLEETNNWDDTYWGVCDGKGKNHLGRILMKVRRELMDTS